MSNRLLALVVTAIFGATCFSCQSSRSRPTSSQQPSSSYRDLRQHTFSEEGGGDSHGASLSPDAETMAYVLVTPRSDGMDIYLKGINARAKTQKNDAYLA